MGEIDRLTAALADRYRVERELGSGGMTTCFWQKIEYGSMVAYASEDGTGFAITGYGYNYMARTRASLWEA